jgi:uncharacterized DUF497 family protein
MKSIEPLASVCTNVHNTDIEFEWDVTKEAANIQKHGISFVTAAELLLSPYYLGRSDKNNEVRYMAIGEVKGRVLSVVYTTRADKYRIISARRARKNEEAMYRKNG